MSADKRPAMPPAAHSITFDGPRRDTISQSSSSLPLNSHSLSNSSFSMFRHSQLTNAMLPDNEFSSQLPQATAAMAPPERPPQPRKLDISSLMSPPDPILDSFSKPATQVHYTTIAPVPENVQGAAGDQDGKQDGKEDQKVDGKQPLPMSPPISPYSQAITPPEPSSALSAHNLPVKDPVLYPQDDSHSSASPTHSPLFAPVDIETQRRVDEHIRSRSPSIFANGVNPPKREDYGLVLNFHSQVFKLYNKDPKAWLRRERGFLMAQKQAAGAKRYTKIIPKPATVKQSARVNRADHRVSKPTTAPRPIRAGGNVNGGTGAGKSSGRTSATPDPSRRIVAPNREDKDFELLPDFSPPLSSLPDKQNCLKVEWKGSPVDLSGDPLAHLLDPNELQLAGILRLDCATYLTSKRRLFIRRLECVGIGKEFRKTDAQQACKIDVNKASKLWVAYDRVGWFDQKWMKPHLNRIPEFI